jgi:hypothetical protein
MFVAMAASLKNRLAGRRRFAMLSLRKRSEGRDIVDTHIRRLCACCAALLFLLPTTA